MSAGASGAPTVVDRAAGELSVRDLHDLLRLRVDVFVVEQECAYAEIDGRDLEPATRHVWVPGDDGPAAYLRVLDAGTERRIGRVVTSGERRGEGLAAVLVQHVLATSAPPWVLDAQAHLADWYARWGFAAVGPEFVEDGIPHVAMRRTAPWAGADATS